MRYADPQACPDCGAPVPGPTRCPRCGLVLSGPLAAELYRTLQHADRLLEQLRAVAPRPSAAEAGGPATPVPPRPTVLPAAPPADPPAPVRQPVQEPSPKTPFAPPAPPQPAEPPPVSAVPRRRTAWTVPMVLLGLGGLLLSVGALLFLALAWSVIGLSGRTLLLVAFTAVAAAGTWFTTRRGLRGAGETLSGITTVLAGLVGLGGSAAGWFGDGPVTHVVVGTGAALATLTLLGRWAVRRSTGVALLVPQVLGAVAVDAAVVTGLVTFEHRAVTATVLCLGTLALSYAARRTGQDLVRLNAYAAAGAAWLTVTAAGLARTTPDLPTRDLTAIGPLLGSAALAAVLVPRTPLTAATVAWPRVVAGSLAVWLGSYAAVAGALDSADALLAWVTGLTVLSAAARVLFQVGSRVATRVPTSRITTGILRTVATSAGAVALVVTVLWLLEAAAHVLVAVADAATSSGARSWTTAFDTNGFDAGLTPFDPMLAAAALAAVLVTWRRLGTVAQALPTTSVVAAGLAPCLAVTVVLTGQLLVVTGGLLLLGVLVLAGTRRTSGVGLQLGHLGSAGLLLGLADLTACFHPVVAAVVAIVVALAAVLCWVTGGSAVREAAAVPAAISVPVALASLGWALPLDLEAVGLLVEAGTLAVITPLTLAISHRSRWAWGAAGWAMSLLAVLLTTPPTDLAGVEATLLALAPVVVGAVSGVVAMSAAGVTVGAAGWLVVTGAGLERAPEPLNVPLALLGVVSGASALWGRRGDGPFRVPAPALARALVPGLVLALLPSTAVAVATDADAQSWRALAVALLWLLGALIAVRWAASPLGELASGLLPITAAWVVWAVAHQAHLDPDVTRLAQALAAVGVLLAVLLTGWARSWSAASARVVGYLSTLLVSWAVLVGAGDVAVGAGITIVLAAALLVAFHERSTEAGLIVLVVLGFFWLVQADTLAHRGGMAGLPELYAVPLGAVVAAAGRWMLSRSPTRGPAPDPAPVSPRQNDDPSAYVEAGRPHRLPLAGLALGLTPSLALAVADPVTVRGLVVAVLGTAAAFALLRWASSALLRVAALAGPVLAAVAGGIAARLGDLSHSWITLTCLLSVLVLTLAALVLGWGAAARRDPVARWTTYAVTLLLGLGLAVDEPERPTWIALQLTVLAAAVALVAISERDRRVAALSSALGLVALWLRLADAQVSAPEAYSLPLAGAVLAFGAWSMWRDAALRTVPALGPGLSIGLVPSLVLALDEPFSWRGFAVGVACLVLVGLGAVLRWQAPFVLGSVAGLVLVVVGVRPYLSHSNPTVLVIVAGAVLLAAGISWERLARAGRTSWAAVARLR